MKLIINIILLFSYCTLYCQDKTNFRNRWDSLNFINRDFVASCLSLNSTVKGQGINLDLYKKALKNPNKEFIRSNASISKSAIFLRLIEEPYFDIDSIDQKLQKAKRLGIITKIPSYDKNWYRGFTDLNKSYSSPFMFWFFENEILKKKEFRKIIVNNFKSQGQIFKDEFIHYSKLFIEGKVDILDYYGALSNVTLFQADSSYMDHEVFINKIVPLIKNQFTSLGKMEIKHINRGKFKISYIVETDSISHYFFADINDEMKISYSNFIENEFADLLNRISADNDFGMMFLLKKAYNIFGLDSRVIKGSSRYQSLFLFKHILGNNSSYIKSDLKLEFKNGEINCIDEFIIYKNKLKSDLMPLGIKTKREIINYFTKYKDSFEIEYNHLIQLKYDLENGKYSMYNMLFPTGKKIIYSYSWNRLKGLGDNSTTMVASELLDDFNYCLNINEFIDSIKCSSENNDNYKFEFKFLGEEKIFIGSNFGLTKYVIDLLNNTIIDKKFYKIDFLQKEYYFYCSKEQFDEFVSIFKKIK